MNGVVGFRNPANTEVETHFCCQGRSLEGMAKNGADISRYGYAIAPLWTDLIDLGVENSGLFADGDASQQRYIWRNLAEYSWPYDNSSINTFELQIKPDGSYTVDYTAVDIQDHSVTIGEFGDLSQGFQGTQQQYYYSGFQGVPEVFSNYESILQGLCAANALYDPQCSGYSAAYAEQLYTQACANDATYDRDCNGYEEAYLEQQCMYDPQYDTTCNGYREPEPEVEIVQIQEAIEQPDLTTDFTRATGYEIPGIPSFATSTNEEPQTEQEPQPIELEQDQESQPEVAEQPIEEIVEREEQEEQREELVAVEEEEEPEPVEEREEPVEEQSDTKQEQPAPKAIANKQTSTPKVTKKQALTKNEKLKALVAKKANALTKKIESAVTLEQQIQVQQQLLSLISFVPDFNYAEQEMQDRASFYPPNALADSSFSRWFVNDPNFEVLEDSQYPQRNTQWQRSSTQELR